MEEDKKEAEEEKEEVFSKGHHFKLFLRENKEFIII